MSAIAGIYHVNHDPIDIDLGRSLMKALDKFPADDVQTWHSERVFLGCHVQWVTPESVGEQLPYYDRERRLAITADAIIDNREELFEKLAVEFGKRRTITDSELILRSYDQWGEEAPKYLAGDFAFMIWDERRQQLFGARDLSGYRTLYFYRSPSRFVFCTTIDPMLSLPYVKKQLNEQWLAEYLVLAGTIDSVDALMTPYQSIMQIPPSHSLLIARDKMKLTRYGNLNESEPLRLNSDEEYVEAFQHVFQQAVTARLRTRRHIGAQLSGGLDSGAVVSFAARALRGENKQIHTFSYIPPKDFVDFTPKRLMPDERPFIQLTVGHVGGIIPHYLDYEDKNSYSEIDDLLHVMEMPYKFFENSFWLKGMFESAREQDVGILLNGDRGNFTISWGSAIDYYANLLRRLRWFRLFREINLYSRNVGGARFRLLPAIARIGFPILHQILPKAPGWELPGSINPEFARRTGIYEKLKDYGIGPSGWISASSVTEERRKLFADLFPWNAGNTLTAKLSLRYGLWKRDPTNDNRVVRFCLSVPEDQYVQDGVDRALIRRATKHLLPDQVRLNQRVRGVQGADWVHRMVPYWGSFLDEIRQLSKDERILSYLDDRVIRAALAKAEQGPRPECDTDPDYKLLMRSLIVYRFVQRFV